MGDCLITRRSGGGGGLKLADWATGSDEEIVAMIALADAGTINLSDFWSVGQTRSVNLSAISDGWETTQSAAKGESQKAQTVEFVLMDSECKGFTITATGKKPSFIVGMKSCMRNTGFMNVVRNKSCNWSNCSRRYWCNNIFYNAVPDTLRPIFKQFTWAQGVGGTAATSNTVTTQDYFAIPPVKAVLGEQKISFAGEANLYDIWEWYKTTSNRNKEAVDETFYNKTAYWLGSPYRNNSGFSELSGGFLRMSDGEFNQYYYENTTYGISPFGCI